MTTDLDKIKLNIDSLILTQASKTALLDPKDLENYNYGYLMALNDVLNHLKVGTASHKFN